MGEGAVAGGVTYVKSAKYLGRMAIGGKATAGGIRTSQPDASPLGPSSGLVSQGDRGRRLGLRIPQASQYELM